MAKTFDKARIHHRSVRAIWRYHDGFSLIELMIVVAIVAILAAIALPVYKRQIQESRRTSAKSALLDLARREETFYSTNNNYTSQMATLGYATVANNTIQVPNNTSQAYYNVTITAPASGGTTAATYQATATPVPGSTQVGDACGTYSIDYLGTQLPSTSAAGNSCW